MLVIIYCFLLEVCLNEAFCHNQYQSRTSNGIWYLHCSWQSQLDVSASLLHQVLPRFVTTKSRDKSNQVSNLSYAEQQLEGLLISSWLFQNISLISSGHLFSGKKRITIKCS